MFDPSSAVDVATDFHHSGSRLHQRPTGPVQSFNQQSPGVILPGTQSDAIGGLEKGKTYAVILIDADHFKLAKDPAIDLDATGTDPTATQTLNLVKAKTFDVDAIDAGTDTIRIAAHGFLDGDHVEYFANGNTPITGLADRAIYTVVKVDDESFQLKDGNGVLVQLAQGRSARFFENHGCCG